MFFTGAEERSLSTIVDGDIESKRSLLTKLYHAAYCQHEGYTEATKCPADPLCCASKRLFEHMSTCTDMSCNIPCCKSCRRVWRHYRKCRHPSACPMCSVVPSAYTSIGLAPRFTQVLPTNTTIMSDRSIASGTTNVSMDSSVNNTSFGSTAAVVVLPPRKKNGFQPPTYGKENATVVSETSSVNSGWIPMMMDESLDQPELDSPQQPSGGSSSRVDDTKPPTTTTTTTATAISTTTSTPEAMTITPTRTTPTPTPKTSPVPSIPTPTTKKIGTPQSYPLPRKVDSPKDTLPSTMSMMNATTTSSSKPPLSPRRPQWALY